MSDISDAIKRLNDALSTGSYSVKPLPAQALPSIWTLPTYCNNCGNKIPCSCPNITATIPITGSAITSTSVSSNQINYLPSVKDGQISNFITSLLNLPINPNFPTPKHLRGFSVVEIGTTARYLQALKIPTLIHQFTVNKGNNNFVRYCVPCEFACKIIDNSAPLGYALCVKKFTSALQYLAENVIIDYGMLGAGIAKLDYNPFLGPGSPSCDMLYAFVFINKDWINNKLTQVPPNNIPFTMDLLNKELGVDMFGMEGQIFCPDWSQWRTSYNKCSGGCNQLTFNCVCTRPAAPLACNCTNNPCICTNPVPTKAPHPYCNICNTAPCSCIQPIPMPSYVYVAETPKKEVIQFDKTKHNTVCNQCGGGAYFGFNSITCDSGCK